MKLDDTDFRSLAAKLRGAAPDAVYFPLYGASLISFAKQLKQAGYSGALLAAETMSDAEIRQLGDLAEGMYVTQAHLDDPAFEERYKSRFGLQKADLNLAHVALGYDVYEFLSACAEAAGQGASVERLRQVIRTTTVTDSILGVTGFNGRNAVERRQEIMVVRNGRLVSVPAGD